MQELACLFSKQSLVCNQMEEDEDEMDIDLPTEETESDYVWMQVDGDEMEED